jgi:hypothetical protein
MWQSESRHLTEAEKGLLSSLKLSLSEEHLAAVKVRKFDVDNSHTIRSVDAFGQKLELSKELEIVDTDGARLSVLYFKRSDGSFGELEVTRLDTKPINRRWD